MQMLEDLPFTTRPQNDQHRGGLGVAHKDMHSLFIPYLLEEPQTAHGSYDP